MPSVSKKQHNFMAAIAKNPSFAKKAGVPRSVGEEFLKADKGRKFKEGGEMKAKSMKAIFGGKETKAEEKAERKAVKGNMAAYKRAEKKYEGEAMRKGGLAAGHKTADGLAKKGKTKGIEVKMRKGGKTSCK